jgi:hypothetical protein
MAAKTWESDFRYRAIQESIRLIRSEHPDDIFRSKSSFCIPVANKPVVGWTPGKVFIIFLVLGFAFLIAGAIIAGIAEKSPKLGDGEKAAAIALGVALCIAGLGCFFAPVLLDRFLMRLVTGARGAELASHPGELLCAEISDTDRSKMKVSIDGDDFVLILADCENQRLLLEGVSARYLIRAEDVTDLKPFQFMSYVGAEITYRISETTCLSLAIARTSVLLETIRQLPFLAFLEKRVKNPILKACREVLGESEFVDPPD